MSGEGNPNPLPQLAAEVVQRALGMTLDERTRQDFAASLVRQWERFSGHAALFTPMQRFWISLSPGEKASMQVRVLVSEGNGLEPLVQSWHISPAQIPDIIQSLNLNQYALLLNEHRWKIRLAVNPIERSVSVDELK